VMCHVVFSMVAAYPAGEPCEVTALATLVAFW